MPTWMIKSRSSAITVSLKILPITTLKGTHSQRSSWTILRRPVDPVLSRRVSTTTRVREPTAEKEELAMLWSDFDDQQPHYLQANYENEQEQEAEGRCMWERGG